MCAVFINKYFFVCVGCVYTCSCACVQAHSCVQAYIYRDQRWTQVSSSVIPHFVFWNRVSFGTEAYRFRQAVQGAQGSSCLSFPSFGAQVQTYVMDTGDPHSGPQASTASMLPTEPSLQSQHDCFKRHLGGFVVRLSLRAVGLACFIAVVRHITGTETFYTTDLAKLVKGICRGLISLNFKYFQDKAASVVLVQKRELSHEGWANSLDLCPL